MEKSYVIYYVARKVVSSMQSVVKKGCLSKSLNRKMCCCATYYVEIRINKTVYATVYNLFVKLLAVFSFCPMAQFCLCAKNGNPGLGIPSYSIYLITPLPWFQDPCIEFLAGRWLFLNGEQVFSSPVIQIGWIEQ